MAHNINYNRKTEKHSMFSRKEIPWHGLGQVVDNALTSEEAILAAGLNYDVIKCPTYAKYPEELKPAVKGDRVPDVYATVRTDTWQVLGSVGNRYEIVQNSTAFDFVDSIVGDQLAIFETAGALGRGERIFLTAKLPTNIRIKGSDDIIEKYILFTNSHDGSGSVVAGFTPIRVVCNNTLNVALHNIQNRITFRHTKNIHDRLEQGREMLGIYKIYSEEFADIINCLANVKITDETVESVIGNVIFTPQERKIIELDSMFNEEISTRKRNQFIDLKEYIDTGVGQDHHRGSALWLYNGFTSYYSNGKEYKNNEERFKNIIDGMAARNTQKVFDEVLTLV